jgi:hypothetical protein
MATKWSNMIAAPLIENIEQSSDSVFPERVQRFSFNEKLDGSEFHVRQPRGCLSDLGFSAKKLADGVPLS